MPSQPSISLPDTSEPSLKVTVATSDRSCSFIAFFSYFSWTFSSFEITWSNPVIKSAFMILSDLLTNTLWQCGGAGSYGSAVQGHSSCTGTLQLGRYQGPRWSQAARWAQCTYIDTHLFSGREDKFINLEFWPDSNRRSSLRLKHVT